MCIRDSLLSLSVAERQSFDARIVYLDAWFNYAAAKTSLDLAAIGGSIVGRVVEGQARYPLQVRFEETARSSLGQLYDIKVASPAGALIPLAQLARINVTAVSYTHLDVYKRQVGESA